MNVKLYFYYGVMSSSKTANALMKKFNFEENGREVALIKPSIDTRYGKTIVKSRAGLSSEAFLVKSDDKIEDVIGQNNRFEIIVADEAQFFTEAQIDELRKFVDQGIMVMCYGLRTDYTGHLFEGSRRLLEVADTIREIPSMCAKCGRKAIMNARYSGQKIIYEGNPIDIGGEDKYITLCHQCWKTGEL
jgi:Thymidine kinase